MDPDLGSQLLSLLTRAADAALLCLTPVRNDSKTQASISLSCWCSSEGNFPLTGFLQEFQCPGFSGRKGGAAPTYGHRVGWGPLSVLGTPSSWERYLQQRGWVFPWCNCSDVDRGR